MAGPRFGDEPLVGGTDVRPPGSRAAGETPPRSCARALRRGRAQVSGTTAPRSQAQRGSQGRLVRAGVRNTISSRTSAGPPGRVTVLRSAPAPTGEAAQVGHASGADQ